MTCAHGRGTPASEDMTPTDEQGAFPDLLKHWRQRSDLSQLDLALRAGVSARHVSFLETGRSRPSQGMALRLASALDIPASERDVLLREAGYAADAVGPAPDALADPDFRRAIDAKLRYHEPFPMLVLDRSYDVVRANEAARWIVSRFVGAVPERWNAMEALFDPDFARPHVEDWEEVAQIVIARVWRESLRDQRGGRIRGLLERLLSAPGVPEAWAEPRTDLGTEPTLPLCLRVDGEVLSFLGTLSVVRAPQNTNAETVLIGSYLPADFVTARVCRSAATA